MNAVMRPEGLPQLKIRPGNLALAAIVYVRQSSRGQVLEHTESTRLQYALAERAVALGWARSQVIVIDDDLGVPASVQDSRKGFSRLVTEVTMGRAGIVLGIEMSRLARTGKDCITCWSCARCRGRFSPTRTRSTIPGTTTTGCCWG